MRFTLSLLPAICLMFSACAMQAQVIVANTSVKVAHVSKADVFDVFTGASSTFSDGSAAVPATLKAGTVHEAFLKEYIGKKELLFRGEWRVLVFSGKGKMPPAFDTEPELLHYIATTPGSIGYVATPPDHEHVKVLPIK